MGKYEFLQALLLPAQAAHSLHMRSKTEHLHRLDHFHFITFSGKEQKIPGQSFRTAGNIYDPGPATVLPWISGTFQYCRYGADP